MGTQCEAVRHCCHRISCSHREKSVIEIRVGWGMYQWISLDMYGKNNTEAAELPLQEDITDSYQWFVQASSRASSLVHFSRSLHQDGRHVPWCRDYPFARMHSETGDNVRSAAATPYQLCSTCLRRMSETDRAAIQALWPEDKQSAQTMGA